MFKAFIYLFCIFFSIFIFINTQGCGSKNCKTTLDCSQGEICDKSDKIQGVCVPKKDIVKTDAGTENHSLPDKKHIVETPQEDQSSPAEEQITDNNIIPEPQKEITPEPSLPTPQKGDLVINEILYNPPNDPVKGDANKDGVRDTYQDEFIEIVNVSNKKLDLEGVKLTDNTTKTYFTFPKGVIVAPKQGIVIFGGGMSQDTAKNNNQPHPNFGDSLVYTASFGGGGTRLALTNSAKTILLKDNQGLELDKFTYGTSECPGNKNESVTLDPDMTGKCTLHSKADSKGSLFSPGTRISGSKFSEMPVEPTTTESISEPTTELISEPTTELISDGGTESIIESKPETTPDVGYSRLPKVGDLIINELNTDPDSKKGDANKDGKISYSFDEFVEIVNNSSDPLRLQGLKLYSKGKVVFTFKAMILAPKGVVIIFGGGSDPLFNSGKPHPKFSNAYVFTSSLNLTNYGKSTKGSNTVELKDAQGMRISFFTYGSTSCFGDQNTSLTLSPDLTGTCALHKDVANGTLFSPGTKLDGSSF